MVFKTGSGWKACFDEENGRYFGEYGGIQSYHLFEITKEQYDRLDETMSEGDACGIMHDGRHLYMAVDDRCGPPYTVVFDDGYEGLCPWARVMKSGRVWSDGLTDAAVELFESEKANRKQRREKKRRLSEQAVGCQNTEKQKDGQYMRQISRDDLDRITALRHLLHSRPGLSLQESGTIGILKDFLRENTTLEIVDRDGWFYAVKRVSAGAVPPVAFRADMDALPMDEGIALPYGSVYGGIAHKCGHDGHMAALCGLALELEKTEAGRTVFLIFQPAEETGRGAVRCADLIREEGIAEIYAFHNISGYPENSIVYRRGLTQPASEGLMIRMQGRQSHASAPEEGCSPSAAVAELALYAQRLPEEPHEGMALCTIVGMHCGEGDFGISPGEGTLCVTLRAEQEPFMKEMEEKLLKKAGELAARDGLGTEHEIHDYFPETRNHDEVLDRVIRQAGRLRLPVVEMQTLWRASEDFGYYLKQCPGAMFYIGSGEEYPALHTAGYDFNDRILKTAAELFLALAEAE